MAADLARAAIAFLMGSAVALHQAGSLPAGAVLPALARRTNMGVVAAVAAVEAVCWCAYPWVRHGAIVLALSGSKARARGC